MRRISAEKKKRIFEIIQIGNQEDAPSRIFDYFIVTVILCNIAVLFLETFDALNAFRGLFERIEDVTVAIFCAEYALRIWTADLLYPDETRPRAVLRFLFSFDGLVDLLTILPFFFLSGFGAFRILRAARILHLFRINTQYDSFQVITSVVKEKKNAILYSVFIILVLILAASLSMYSAEHAAQPEVFKNALSGIWWSVSTVFTVGPPAAHAGRRGVQKEHRRDPGGAGIGLCRAEHQRGGDRASGLGDRPDPRRSRGGPGGQRQGPAGGRIDPYEAVTRCCGARGKKQSNPRFEVYICRMKRNPLWPNGWIVSKI